MRGVESKFQADLPEEADWFVINSEKEYLNQINQRLAVYVNHPKAAAFMQDYNLETSKLLWAIATRLTKEHSHCFKWSEDNTCIINNITGIKIPLFSGDPVIAILNLVPQDINLLLSEKGEEHRLVFSLTIYSVGWYAADRIGSTLSELHKPVPNWEEIVKPRVLGLFKRMSRGKITRQYRINKFVQFGKDLARFSKKDYDISKLSKDKLAVNNLFLRQEYQVFIALSLKMVLLSVHTEIRPLTTLNLDELVKVYKEYEKMKSDLQGYHDFDKWGPIVDKHIKELQKS